MYCGNCGTQIHNKAVVCINCGVPPRLEKKFCHNCGTASSNNQAICLSCGVPIGRGPGQKSKSTYTLLTLLLGIAGGHKFYMGSWGWGIIYLVLLLTFYLAWIPWIATLVELIRAILTTEDEFAIKAEEFKDKGPFGFFW